VCGKKNLVSPDHPWVVAARRVGTCFGDEPAATLGEGDAD